MELRSINYFVAIAELGNISAAALKLGIAQPALTRHIKQLESELNTILFNRLARGVQLTASGRELLEYANRIVSEVAQAKHEISGLRSKPKGSIVFGASPTISSILMPKVVSDTLQEFPGIHMRLMEGRSIRLNDFLLTGLLDIAILTNPLPSYKLHLTPLISEPLCLIGIAGILPRQSPMTMDELDQLPLILTPGMLALTLKAKASKKSSLNVIAEIESIDTIRSLVKAGKAITIAPASAFHVELNGDELQAITIEMKDLRRDLVLASRTDNAHLPAVREVSRIVKAAVKTQMGRYAAP
ncbi:LysR family transcriptional regulator [Polynucleobacter sinensis]|jgi:LysR family nitrogen assimilation transcriptional regulator|uniref:LysR family transcriptional regulator n=1 Tax=Polynucleobacter sinensis TaxID=1743157 RepID=UPI000780879B|nr:LysR family transcriptional regulator [Polynucleobacter sinensis]